MSLSSAYSPKIGMSGSFGSGHCLTDLETKSGRQQHRKTFPAPDQSGASEHSSLLKSDMEGGNNKQLNKQPSPPSIDVKWTWPLIMTILAVTVGSSLQFGCVIIIIAFMGLHREQSLKCSANYLNSFFYKCLLFSPFSQKIRYRRHEQQRRNHFGILSPARKGIHGDAMGNHRFLLRHWWPCWIVIGAQSNRGVRRPSSYSVD